MSDSWQTYELKDILKPKGYIRGPFGSSLKRNELKSFGIPVYEQQHAIENSREFRYYIGEEKFNEMRRFQVQTNDLIISCSGTIGSISIITENDPKGIISQALLILRVNPDKVLPKYLRYFFYTPFGANKLLQSSYGSVQTNIASRSIVETIELNIPSVVEQNKIVSILSSLDDKIELNLKMNQTLETIAQTIFKRWFVDFQFPGASGEMENDLPKGWIVGKINAILDLVYGKGLKAEDRIQGAYPVIGSSGIVGYHNQFLVKGPGIVIGRKGTIGEVIWIEENFSPIDTTFYVKDLIGVEDLFFHYFLLRQQEFKKIISDSAVPGLNRNSALSTEVVIPPIEVISKFNGLIKPLFKKIQSNIYSNNLLSKIRDSLLPKLITGKIPVS